MAINDEVLSPHEKKDVRVLNEVDNEDVPADHGDGEMEKDNDFPLDVLIEFSSDGDLISLNQKKIIKLFQSRGLFFD